MLYPGWRLLLDGRAGLWLPNYQHVNATYNASIHYAAASASAASRQQPFCPQLAGPDGGPTARTAEQEESGGFDAAENVVASLFPAMQILHESPVVAACSRFVIETARVQVCDGFSHASPTAPY